MGLKVHAVCINGYMARVPRPKNGEYRTGLYRGLLDARCCMMPACAATSLRRRWGRTGLFHAGVRLRTAMLLSRCRTQAFALPRMGMIGVIGYGGPRRLRGYTWLTFVGPTRQSCVVSFNSEESAPEVWLDPTVPKGRRFRLPQGEVPAR